MVKIQMRWDMHCAEALIVNGRVDEGIDMLKPRRPASAFRMYTIQNRFQDAFALAELDYPSAKNAAEWFEKASTTAASGSEAGVRQFELGVEVGRLLFQLGKQDEARQGFQRLAATVWNGARGSQLLKVCEAEQKSGMRKEALTHAARILSHYYVDIPFEC